MIFELEGEYITMTRNLYSTSALATDCLIPLLDFLGIEKNMAQNRLKTMRHPSWS